MYKTIPDYPDYVAFENGNVYSKRRHRLMRPSKKKTGYYELAMYNSNGVKYFSVHRIIAELFIEKPKGAEEVNHINGNKSDNSAKNLEWVTHGNNLKHAYETKLREQDVSPKKVVAISITDGTRLVFKSIYRAARELKISQGNICMACKKQRPYAGGYYWEYLQEG